MLLYGSGFFISADGLFITNYHVIHNATIFKVWTYDRVYHYEAEVVATDPIADLAMLKLIVPEHLNDMPFHEISKNLILRGIYNESEPV